MSDSFENFFIFFGVICFLTFIIDYPYELLQGKEFDFSATRFFIIMIVSFGCAFVEYYYSGGDENDGAKA
jgi:hypothetical protein